MKKINAKDSFILQAGEVISASADIVLKLSIDCGRVWVTQEGDEYDYWLQAGETLVLQPLRHIVIEADGEFSRVDLLPCPMNERTPTSGNPRGQLAAA
ncbi:DUF2917 domain-containing protein [Undibacterium terreum]|uniref:DUF2917 domain-containing protein n=1 Tax=Undibacterium terreum TaxID=1224302 RepID=A0A916ULB8_9BURK|nr:DUF2917 domain-containing protein [Undibacterium terreum]GGC75204.1 hypothetical protein GCM10011396_23040 [Undibacterium terreum]